MVHTVPLRIGGALPAYGVPTGHRATVGIAASASPTVEGATGGGPPRFGAHTAGHPVGVLKMEWNIENAFKEKEKIL